MCVELRRQLRAARELADERGAEIARLSSLLDAAVRDRDEYRTQHDNAVTCWYADRDALAAKTGGR